MLHIGLAYKFNMEKRYYSNIRIYGLVEEKAARKSKLSYGRG